MNMLNVPQLWFRCALLDGFSVSESQISQWDLFSTCLVTEQLEAVSLFNNNLVSFSFSNRLVWISVGEKPDRIWRKTEEVEMN